MVDAHGNVFPLVRLLKSTGVHGLNVLLWFANEYLPISVRNTMSSRVLDLCRLIAFLTIVALMMFETRAAAFHELRIDWFVFVLDGILAILVGNIVKECAIWVSARIANSLSVNFYRRGVMLNGKRFSEVFRSDGTWRRCEFGDRETVCEWTDRFGAISRSVTGPRLECQKARRAGAGKPPGRRASTRR